MAHHSDPQQAVEQVSDQPQRWTFTLQTAATVTGLSIATLRRREKEGRLRFYRVGARTLVCAKSLRELLGMPDTS